MKDRRDSLQDALFYLALSLFVCHELDAVAHHEWRLLPVLNALDEIAASAAFIMLHAPVLTLLFWLTGHRSDVVRLRSRLVTDGYFVVHSLLHASFSQRVDYEFEAPVETITVYGSAAVALVHVLLFIVTERRRNHRALLRR